MSNYDNYVQTQSLWLAAEKDFLDKDYAAYQANMKRRALSDDLVKQAAGLSEEEKAWATKNQFGNK